MKRFLALWLVGLVILVGAVAAFDVAIDAYGILGTPRIAGLNAEKTAAADRPRLTKSYLVDRVDAGTLLLGASNVDVGLDPQSAVWSAAAQPVFNLAIDGSLPGVLFRYLQHALVRSHPRLILVGLAMEDTMIMPAKRLGAADQALYSFAQRLHTQQDGTPNPGYLAARLEDTLFATLSTQALTDSVLTLFRQNQPDRNQQTPLGRNTGGSFVRWTRAEGSYALVMAKVREKSPQFLAWAAEPRLDLAPLGDIVRLAHAHGAQLAFFIQPTYVDELEVIRQAGLTTTWNAWKTEAVRIIAEAAGDKPVPIWDFSGFSPYTTEPLPTPGDTTRQLTWFWEPIHYRKELGDLMIRRMVEGGEPLDFGVRVTPATIAAHEAEMGRQQRDWVASHPADVRRVATLVDAAAQAFCHGPVDRCPRPAPLALSSR